MKKFPLYMIALVLSCGSAIAGDRYDRGYSSYETRHNDVYQRRDDRSHDNSGRHYRDYRESRRRDPVVIYRVIPGGNSYGRYGYQPSRYPTRASYDYYGNRYIQHRGRYYDQCSSGDRQAAALAGIVLGGAIGSQVSSRNQQVGALVGAAVGGLIANEMSGGFCR